MMLDPPRLELLSRVHDILGVENPLDSAHILQTWVVLKLVKAPQPVSIPDIGTHGALSSSMAISHISRTYW